MKKIVFLLIVVLLSSCIKKFKTPDYVIPHDKMINIIIDLHITDGLLTVNNVRRNLAKDSIRYYNAIFSNYGYTRSDFDTSIYYYSENIDEYDKIYEEVLNRLNEMETNLKQESVAEEEKKLADKEKKANRKERLNDTKEE